MTLRYERRQQEVPACTTEHALKHAESVRGARSRQIRLVLDGPGSCLRCRHGRSGEDETSLLSLSIRYVCVHRRAASNLTVQRRGLCGRPVTLSQAMCWGLVSSPRSCPRSVLLQSIRSVSLRMIPWLMLLWLNFHTLPGRALRCTVSYTTPRQRAGGLLQTCDAPQHPMLCRAAYRSFALLHG